MHVHKAMRVTCKASSAVDVMRGVSLGMCHFCVAISLHRRAKGTRLMRRLVDFWYFLISFRAAVPGLYLHAVCHA